jgi:hypothetical protein
MPGFVSSADIASLLSPSCTREILVTSTPSSVPIAYLLRHGLLLGAGAHPLGTTLARAL